MNIFCKFRMQDFSSHSWAW